MSEKTYQPSYHCWKEGDFWADRRVNRMLPTQRHYYRALIQAAFHCSTRPYLPNNDEDLYLLADPEDHETWDRLKGPVLAMFSTFVTEEGERLLGHKRIISDWEQMMGSVNKKIKAGKARHKKEDARTGVALASAEHNPAHAPKLKLKNKTENKLKSTSITETETVAVPVSVSVLQSEDVDIKYIHNKEQSIAVAKVLLSRWKEITNRPGSLGDFAKIANKYKTLEAALFECYYVIYWSEKVSNFWPKKVRDSTDFLSKYRSIAGQFENYFLKMSKEQTDVVFKDWEEVSECLTEAIE